MSEPLYKTDFYRWSTEQGQAIRDAAAARINTPSPIDWDNVAEEIESLGRSQRTAVRSRLATILEHLMKLQASPAEAPRTIWRDTIRRSWDAIEIELEDSPSLRREIPALMPLGIKQARRAAQASLAEHGEQPLTDITQLSYTADQVLGDWFPD